MPSTALRYPASMSTAADVGTRSWTNPSQGGVSDNLYATTTIQTGDTSHYLIGRDYGFDADLPATAIITGITVGVEAKVDANSISAGDRRFKLTPSAGVYGGDVPGTTSAIATTEAIRLTSGTPADFGLSGLTAADVRSANFGLAFRIFNATVTGTLALSVDALPMSFDYILPSGDQVIFIG